LPRYLVRLENSRKAQPEQINGISSEFGKAVKAFDVSLRNFRVTGVAVEFDLFAKDTESKEKAVRSLVSDFGSLLSERNLSEERQQKSSEDKRETVKLVVELFNEQRYWECHEVMEVVWRKEKLASEKSLQQGIILAASALVHAQRNEDGVCLGMLPRTLDKLKRWEKPHYYGLNVDLLKSYLQGILETHNIIFQKI
jgi:uncharacterized protein